MLLTWESSDDDTPATMLAEAEARADETALPALSVATILESSEPIEEEMAERTLEAEATTPLVGRGRIGTTVAESLLETVSLLGKDPEEAVNEG